MDYKEMYDKVIASGAYPRRSDKIKELAQLNFNNCPSNGREQAVCDALEDYEMMTGNWHDPSKDEYQEWQDSIVNPLRKEIESNGGLKMKKVMAMIHSLHAQAEVEIIKENGQNDIVALYNGKECTAVFNPFVCMYYVDDVYGILGENPRVDERK